jgi:hypothetical protein
MDSSYFYHCDSDRHSMLPTHLCSISLEAGALHALSVQIDIDRTVYKASLKLNKSAINWLLRLSSV